MSDKYPEHEKLRAVKHETQTVGEFIEWLNSHGYYICERRDAETRTERVRDFFKTGARVIVDIGDAFAVILEAVADNACLYWPTMKRLPESLLAEYFDINPDTLESETRAMLDELRSRQPA